MRVQLLLVFTLFLLKASASFVPSDTSWKSMKHASEEQFLQRFGTDDSSRALIGYYFEVRKRTGKAMVWSGPALAASVATTAIVSANRNNGMGEPAAIRGVLLAVIAGAVILFFMTFFGTAALMRLFYSRRTLYNDLQRYNAGKGIRNTVARSRRFRMFLEAEKNSR